MTSANSDYGQFTAPGEVRFVRFLPGPIERVWEYLTDAEKRGRWLARGSMELHVGGAVNLQFCHAELSPHTEEVPAKYRESCGASGEAARCTGRVTRCEPPSFLSYTWGESSGAASEVTFELSAQGSRVQLVLTHRRLGEDRGMLTSVASGWHTHVDILIAKLAGAEPLPFWSTHETHEVAYEKLLP